MATNLQISVALGLYGSYDSGNTQTGAIENIGVGLSTQYVDGTAASKADKWHHVSLALEGASQSLDFAGTLLDIFGNAFTPATIRAQVFNMVSTNSGLVCTITGNLLEQIDGRVSAQREVQNGGWAAYNMPNTSYTVTGGSADVLTFNPGADTMTFDVYTLGTSA